MLACLQYGTPWHDGTDGVTQCAIMPGETLDYKFVVDRVSLKLANIARRSIQISVPTIFFFLPNTVFENVGWDISLPCTLWDANISGAVWIHYCKTT